MSVASLASVPIRCGEAEEPWLSEMDWATPQYLRNQVDKAGFTLADANATPAELALAFDVINNWRASHSFPLNNFQNNLRVKVRNIQSDVLVVQRIKRLESIRSKLMRDQTSTLQLSQMQDIGGCPAILKSPMHLQRLVASYHRSKFNHKLKSEKDYVKSPKQDGYRGHHLVYQYQSSPSQNSAYDKLRIEIQLRTSLQHCWATAVEAVGTFTQQALKSAQGSEDWRRLFALMGTVIARIEKCPLIPGTPADEVALRAELRDLAAKLNAVTNLSAYSVALDYVGTLNQKASKYFLVRYDSGEHKVYVSGFAGNASQAANNAYTEAEKSKKPLDNLVLVAADSIHKLKRAYPNYFLDTQQFPGILWNEIRSNQTS
jgi:hypothetical protein